MKMKSCYLFLYLVFISAKVQLSDGIKWILWPSNKTLAQVGFAVYITCHYKCEGDGLGFSIISHDGQDIAARYGIDERYKPIKNNSNIYFIGRSNVTIVIKNVDEHKQGRYCCKVQCRHKTTREKCTTVVIYALPRINYLTPRTNTQQGKSIPLTCNASGDPAPRATWIHRDTNTVIVHSSVTSLNITGKASGGQYCCHVSNGYGNATNCTSVKVLVLPRINYLTPKLYTTQGDSITLKCNASGDPAPRATWIHRDTNTVVAHSSVTSLNITGKASGGRYCCHVSNGHGNADNCTSVNVKEYQPINTKLTSKIKFSTRNETFKVSCKADASPPAEYFIKPDNSAMVNSSDGNITVTTPITGTSISISCIAKNKYGEGNEVYLKIPIYKPVTIVTHWESEIVMMNKSFTFYCEATGFPTPNIVWFNATDNKTISSENRTLSVQNEDCKNKTLKYICMAKNIVNSVTTPLTVQAICKNEKPTTKVDDETHNRLQIILVVFACAIVLLILVLVCIFISRRRNWLKRDIIKDKQQQDSRQNQVVEEDPYGDPVDAIQVGFASASNADYATVEETGYKRVKTSNHLQEPQHRKVSDSKKVAKAMVEPVYAKLNKKNKKHTSTDVPLNPLYAEIPQNIPKVSPKQDHKTSDNQKSNEEEDGVDSDQGSWCPWRY